MRSFLLSVFTAFLVLPVLAQPTITSTAVAPGDVFVFASVKVAGLSAPATGANKTWDYSALVDSGGYEIDSFKSVASTPYGHLFPAANIALKAGTGGYGYYQNNSSNFSTVGFIYPGDTSYYRKPLSNIHFPFTYGSTYNDSTYLVTYYQDGVDSSKEVVKQHATAYGTLKLPGGRTYNNVLQVTTQTIDEYNFGGFPYTSVSTSILFLQQGSNFYLMSVSLDDQGDVDDVQYLHPDAIAVTNYTFTGNGNWSNAANWSGGKVPPSTVPTGSTVTISPQVGGKCVLDVQVIIQSGASFKVNTGASLVIDDNLIINQ